MSDKGDNGVKFDRTDRATRMLIDGLHEVTGGLEDVRTEIAEDRKTRTQQVKDQVEANMGRYVPWLAFVGLLIGFLALNWGMTDKQIAPAKTAAERAEASSASTQDAVKDLARDLAIELAKIKANAEATANVTVRGERPSVAKEELERRTGEKRTPTKKER
jgi:hypothetical protein